MKDVILDGVKEISKKFNKNEQVVINMFKISKEMKYSYLDAKKYINEFLSSKAE